MNDAVGFQAPQDDLDPMDDEGGSHASLMAGEAAFAVPVGTKPPKFVRPSRRGEAIPKPPKRVQAAHVPACPPANPNPDENGHTPLLLDGEPLTADEQYGENERKLSDFLALHPMLSLESTGSRSLQLMANLLEETCIPVQEVEVIPKSFDDQMLRPPLVSAGERPCVLADRCIARWLAIFRYGQNTDKAFVCREFLTPLQLKAFQNGGAAELPSRRGKCLLCTRYLLNYIYILARNDNSFRPTKNLALNAFGNAICADCDVDGAVTTSSVTNATDGYLPSAMLFVDEQFAETAAARGPLGTLLWRPTVKFHSSHYKYVVDQSGIPRILQVGVAVEDPISTLHFQQRHPPKPAVEVART